MVINKNDLIYIPSICCLDTGEPKEIIEFWTNEREHQQIISLISNCPICGKDTTTEFKIHGQSPTKRGAGFKITYYQKGE